MSWRLTELSGVCVQAGYGSGPVRLIDDERGAAGCVLVAKAIEPAQVPVLFDCAALLLESDDLSSHAAITARELGVPTLADVSGATTLLTSGEHVYVDTELRRIFRAATGPHCPFCTAPADMELLPGRSLRVVHDLFPVVRSHALVVPRRHVTDPAALTAADWAELGELVLAFRTETGAADLNIAMNIGPAAGQTVEHLHWHLMPRFPGDDPDPRGGLRRIVANPLRPYPRPPDITEA